MTLRSLLFFLLLTLVVACAQQEEPMEEPMVMEEPCGNGDGIGGTGCKAEQLYSRSANRVSPPSQ